MGKNLTIFQKGLLLSAVPLLVQLFYLAILGKLQEDSAAATSLAVHTKEVIAQAEGTYRQLLEAQNASRGLVLTGNPAFATAYQAAVRGLLPDLDHLEWLVRDNPDAQARVRNLHRGAAQLLQWLDEEVQLVKAGRRDEALLRVQSQHGQRLLEDWHIGVTAFLDAEDKLDAARMSQLRRTSGWMNWALAAGGVVALITTSVLALLLSQGVARRMATLRDNARLMSEGKGMAPRLTGHDEVAEVDRAFHEMADVLAQKNQENELFVYSVSHDLRSPLVNLQGFSQELNLACRDLRHILDSPDVPVALREQARRVLEGNVAEATHFIQTAVSRLGHIIDALLRLSRAGRVEYRPQEVNLQATVGRVVEALRGTISQRGAEVVVSDLPPCWADPTAVEQVFANLIGNAVNYLDPSRPGQIEIGSAESGPGVNPHMRVYYVRDNGQGIAPAYQQQVFTAFQRLHGDSVPGEGIGLALVRRAVERHGGKVWVESVAGEGSTFYISLPAGPPEASAGRTAAAAAAVTVAGQESAV
jgi:signal transduction histidine kinase